MECSVEPLITKAALPVGAHKSILGEVGSLLGLLLYITDKDLKRAKISRLLTISAKLSAETIAGSFINRSLSSLEPRFSSFPFMFKTFKHILFLDFQHFLHILPALHFQELKLTIIFPAIALDKLLILTSKRFALSCYQLYIFIPPISINIESSIANYNSSVPLLYDATTIAKWCFDVIRSIYILESTTMP